MTTRVAYLRRIPSILALLASSAALLVGLLRLSSGRHGSILGCRWPADSARCEGQAES